VHSRWLVVALLLLATGCSTETYKVSGHAMDNTLHDGDEIDVDTDAYHDHIPERGDIVVHRVDLSNGKRGTNVKRVVGLAGETLEYQDCVLYIDGDEVAEPYLDPSVVTVERCGPDQAPIAIPDGFVFVMGDNRAGSRDSRDYGPVSFNDLIGKVVD
jgi:signal peptidase I